ncbi:MAG: hypothetical protein LBF90_02400 [Prevotellaceae bacterium]|jgi:hypothetical protein|nr:hypothetical protein [Prevotellaceae bacterium]
MHSHKPTAPPSVRPKRAPATPATSANSPKRVFLYIGLTLLLAAFIAQWGGAPSGCFGLLLGVAIAFKTLFLITVFRARGFRLSLWLCFILAGVALMLAARLFKTLIPSPSLYAVLFYGAIALKCAGLLLALRRHARKNPALER